MIVLVINKILILSHLGFEGHIFKFEGHFQVSKAFRYQLGLSKKFNGELQGLELGFEDYGIYWKRR